MSESWISVLSFMSAAFVALGVGTLIYDRLLRYRNVVNARLRELSDENAGAASASVFKNINGLHLKEQIDVPTWQDKLRQQIEQAGDGFSVHSFVVWIVGGAVAAAIAGILWLGWIGAVLGPVGGMVPIVLVNLRKRRCRNKLYRQLPEAFGMISRAVKAGQTIPSALKMIAEDFDPPISIEFARCHEQQNLGLSRESALRQLAKRTGIMELQIFVVGVLVQAKSGGDLVDLLDNLSVMIRKRLRLRDRVRALTGEGRMQALVLLILPVAAFAGIILLSPEYANCLLERPWLLAGTAAAQAAGTLWIQRIVNFEY